MENSNMTLYDWCMENGREDILKEWDQERNGSFTPNTISLESGGSVFSAGIAT